MTHDSWNRRQWMKRQGATAASLLVGVTSHSARAAGALVKDIRVISEQPDYYHGWSTMTQGRKDELLLVYSGGRESHVCPFGRVELMRSRDEGQTWSWPEVILDGPIDDRDAGVVVTPKGAILVTTFTSLAYEPILEKARAVPESWDTKRLSRWTNAHERLSKESRQKALGIWMTRSSDGGLTWSRRFDPLVNSPHGPIVTSADRLLYAGISLWKESRRIGVSESMDDGESWQWLSDIPVRKGDAAANYHELHMVEANPGRLVVHIRNHNTTNSRETLQCESNDGGKTWSTPHSISVWGLPSHLLRLRDGRLLMSYGHRRKPFGNQARLSDDHGNTWSEPLTISDDGSSGDLGYPTTVELAGGDLLTVWYERLAVSPRAVLRQARWSLK